MTQRILRGAAAFAATTATATALLLTSSATAGAAVPGIQTPTMSVVCTQPHQDGRFMAARYTQRGLWAAGEQVTITITRFGGTRILATVHGTTGTTGWFRISRVIGNSDTLMWRRGVRYMWTTEISTASSVTARRGTVELRGIC